MHTAVQTEHNEHWPSLYTWIALEALELENPNFGLFTVWMVERSPEPALTALVHQLQLSSYPAPVLLSQAPEHWWRLKKEILSSHFPARLFLVNKVFVAVQQAKNFFSCAFKFILDWYSSQRFSVSPTPDCVSWINLTIKPRQSNWSIKHWTETGNSSDKCFNKFSHLQTLWTY